MTCDVIPFPRKNFWKTERINIKGKIFNEMSKQIGLRTTISGCGGLRFEMHRVNSNAHESNSHVCEQLKKRKF